MKSVERTVLKISLIVLAVLGLGAASLFILVMQLSVSPKLTKLKSPSLIHAEVWLAEEGFQGRGFVFYARTNNGKPDRVTELDWNGLYQFSTLQWTKDGKIAIFSVLLVATNHSVIRAFGYDFENDRSILPSWQGSGTTEPKTLFEWKQHENKLLVLAEEHGGLNGESFDVRRLKGLAKNVWFWQLP